MVFAATIGMTVTCISLPDLLRRLDRTPLRMGYDSAAVPVAYGAALACLYFLR